jgi:hypothetical protein
MKQSARLQRTCACSLKGNPTQAEKGKIFIKSMQDAVHKDRRKESLEQTSPKALR